MSNAKFAISEVLPGKLNALVKNIMVQVGASDANEAVRLVNSGERVVVEPNKLNPCWIRISNTMVAVNLSAPPSLPFKDAKVVEHIGEGGALLEKRPDGLYLSMSSAASFRKILLHLSTHQQNGKRIKGNELCEELTGKPVLNVNVLDALYDNPDLIPEDWKKDEKGNVLYIFFWRTIYCIPDTGRLYVRFLYFVDGSWRRSYNWLDYDWNVVNPAALLAS